MKLAFSGFHMQKRQPRKQQPLRYLCSSEMECATERMQIKQSVTYIKPLKTPDENE